MEFSQIIMIICDALSLIGSFCIIFLFLYFKKLRQGLFSHIIIYITIGAIIQNIGIQLSNKNYSNLCVISVCLIIFGSLVMILQNIFMMWSIRSIFIVYKAGGDLEELEKKHNYLKGISNMFTIGVFTFALLMTLWPIFVKNEIYTQSTNTYCYIEISSQYSTGLMIQANIEKLLIWEIPILTYFLYSVKVIMEIKSIFIESEEEIFVEVEHLIRRLLLFPLAAFIACIQFTIQDFETLFGVDISQIQATLSWSFLAIWGALNAVAYLLQTSVQSELFMRKLSEQECKSTQKQSKCSKSNGLGSRLQQHYRRLLLHQQRGYVSQSINQKSTISILSQSEYILNNQKQYCCQMSVRRAQSAITQSKTIVTIPYSELKRMQDKITVYPVDEAEKFDLYYFLIFRHKKSQDRVRNWTNTLKQNKVQKDRTKFERFKKDEEERRRIDEEESKYLASVKEKILGKANQQIYENNERLRQFQSKMLVVDALQEREGHQQIKEIQQIMNKERERRQYEAMLELQAEKDLIEQQKQEELLLKKKSQQVMLKKQHEIMKDKYIRQLHEEKIEGELIKAKAIADLEEEQRKEKNRKEKVKENQQLMIQGNEVIKKQKESEREKLLIEERKIEEYAKNKERVMQIRKIRDDQRKAEKQLQRQKLIEIQTIKLAKQKEEQNKILNKNIQEAEIKAEEVELRKKEQRKKLQSAIDYSHKVKQEVAELKKQQQEQEDKEFQLYWINRNKELHNQELEEKAQIRQRQNKLKEYHFQQQSERQAIQVNNLMKEIDEKDKTQSIKEQQDKQFEQWALNQIEKFKAEGKNTDLLYKELNQFKYK